MVEKDSERGRHLIGRPPGSLRDGSSTATQRLPPQFGTRNLLKQMDLTPVFNQVLAAHDTQLVQPHVFRLQDLDEFLKEAYRIVGHVAPSRV